MVVGIPMPKPKRRDVIWSEGAADSVCVGGEVADGATDVPDAVIVFGEEVIVVNVVDVGGAIVVDTVEEDLYRSAFADHQDAV